MIAITSLPTAVHALNPFATVKFSFAYIETAEDIYPIYI